MRSVARACESGLAGVGCLLLAVVGETLVEGRVREYLGTQQLDSGLRRAAQAETQTAARPSAGMLLGRLEIPRLKMSAIIVEGAAEGELRTAVGHLPESAPLGAGGNAAVAGHRDTAFRPLRHVREGDRIALTTWDGDYEYEVVSAQVVEADALKVLAPTSEPTLTLITCYPFSYIGLAPQRFVVQARRVGPKTASMTIGG